MTCNEQSIDRQGGAPIDPTRGQLSANHCSSAARVHEEVSRQTPTVIHASAILLFHLQPGKTIVMDFATATVRSTNTVVRLPRAPTDGISLRKGGGSWPQSLRGLTSPATAFPQGRL